MHGLITLLSLTLCTITSVLAGGVKPPPTVPSAPAPTTITRIPSPTPLIVHSSTYDPASNAYIILANRDDPTFTDSASYLYAYDGNTGAGKASAIKVALKGQEYGVKVVTAAGTAYAVVSTKTFGEIGGDVGVMAFSVSSWKPLWNATLPRFTPDTMNIPVSATVDNAGNLYVISSIGIPTSNGFVAYATRTYKLTSSGSITWTNEAGTPPPAQDATLTPTAIAVSDSLSLIAVVGNVGVLVYNKDTGNLVSSLPTNFPDGRPGLAVAFSGSSLFVSTYLSTYTINPSTGSILSVAAMGGSFVVAVPGSTSDVYLVNTLALSGNTADWNVAVGRVSAGTVVWSKEFNSGGMDIAAGVEVDTGGLYLAVQGTSVARKQPQMTGIKYTPAGAVTWIGRDDSADGARVAALNPASGNFFVTSLGGITNVFK
ncbi:hypothetical protein HDU67_001420 [Dinochytrium kinnereticum]|nr:hypothetical protein HDU67_001420 [Dinochytrium kinnereticum]